MNISHPRRPIVSAIVLAALGTLAAPAIAGPVFENATGGSVTFYGQLNPAYLSFDDGAGETGTVVDNSHSNSRVGLLLTQPLDGATFAFSLETALGARASAGVSQTSTPDGFQWDKEKLRKIDFSLKTANAGTLSAGQGSMASDGAAEVDKSGTALVNYSSIGDTAGSVQFQIAPMTLSGISIGSAFPNFDGGRRGRVRYDSPSFGGLVLSAAYGTEILRSGVDDDYTDVALRYSTQIGAIDLSGALAAAWTDRQAGTDTRDVIGSLSLLHSSGVNLTLAGGGRDTSGDYMYVKLGYRADWFAAGKTSVAADYYTGNDTISAGSDAETVGIGVVQNFDAANVEAYLGYRSYAYSDTTANTYLDVSSVLFGARWKF